MSACPTFSFQNFDVHTKTWDNHIFITEACIPSLAHMLTFIFFILLTLPGLFIYIFTAFKEMTWKEWTPKKRVCIGFLIFYAARWIQFGYFFFGIHHPTKYIFIFLSTSTIFNTSASIQNGWFKSISSNFTSSRSITQKYVRNFRIINIFNVVVMGLITFSTAVLIPYLFFDNPIILNWSLALGTSFSMLLGIVACILIYLNAHFFSKDAKSSMSNEEEVLVNTIKRLEDFKKAQLVFILILLPMAVAFMLGAILTIKNGHYGMQYFNFLLFYGVTTIELLTPLSYGKVFKFSFLSKSEVAKSQENRPDESSQISKQEGTFSFNIEELSIR